MSAHFIQKNQSFPDIFNKFTGIVDVISPGVISLAATLGKVSGRIVSFSEDLPPTLGYNSAS